MKHPLSLTAFLLGVVLTGCSVQIGPGPGPDDGGRPSPNGITRAQVDAHKQFAKLRAERLREIIRKLDNEEINNRGDLFDAYEDSSVEDLKQASREVLSAVEAGIPKTEGRDNKWSSDQRRVVRNVLQARLAGHEDRAR